MSSKWLSTNPKRRITKLSTEFHRQRNTTSDTTRPPKTDSSPRPSTSFSSPLNQKSSSQAEALPDLLTPPASGVKGKIKNNALSPTIVAKKPRYDEETSEDDEDMDVEEYIIVDQKLFKTERKDEESFDDSYFHRLDMNYAENNALKYRGNLSPRKTDPKIEYQNYPNGCSYDERFSEFTKDIPTQKHMASLYQENNGIEPEPADLYQHVICGLHHCQIDIYTHQNVLFTAGPENNVNMPLCNVAVQKVVSRNHFSLRVTSTAINRSLPSMLLQKEIVEAPRPPTHASDKNVCAQTRALMFGLKEGACPIVPQPAHHKLHVVDPVLWLGGANFKANTPYFKSHMEPVAVKDPKTLGDTCAKCLFDTLVSSGMTPFTMVGPLTPEPNFNFLLEGVLKREWVKTYFLEKGLMLPSFYNQVRSS